MTGPAQSRKTNLRRRPVAPALALIVLVATAGAGFGSAGKAVQKVEQGITRFQAGEFEAAGKAFAEADVAKLEDPRIAFDRGCVCAAQNDSSRAKEFFQQAALSRETDLSVRAHYNLGCLAAENARAVFGKKPIDATAEQRQDGLALLAAAVRHYRDCLRLDPEHGDARHNLETIRLWIKQMQALWEKKDRQKARTQMNLLEFLAMLEARQMQLRAATKSLVAESDSPKRRQTQKETESGQRKLAEEINPLKEKIEAQFKSPPTPQGSTPGPPPATGTNAQTDKIRDLLTRLAGEAGRSMLRAADRVAGDVIDEALESQRDVLDRLNEIWMAVVPFASVVQRAVAAQQSLVDRSTALTEKTGDETEVDSEDLAWNQSRVAGWSKLLPLKAKAELPNLQAQQSALSAAASQAAGKSKPQPDPDAAKKQIEGLKASMNKAIKLGPQVEKLAGDAAARLQDEKIAEALPKQEQALKLLKEIAGPLPKQKQSGKGDDKQNRNGRKKDEQQQLSEDGQQKKQKQSSQDLSREQAQSVLRRAREREHKHRDMQNNMQRFLARPMKVDKDW